MAYDNPLTMKGLKWPQRFCYLGSMVHWAGGLFKLAIYLTPILMMFSGVAPVAMQMGSYVAEQIRRRLTGPASPEASRPFHYHDRGNMATIGRASAVADLGWTQFSGYPAWLAWQGGLVATLARGVYDLRCFVELPLLALALEQAGCDREGLLAHLRAAVPSLQCWGASKCPRQSRRPAPETWPRA